MTRTSITIPPELEKEVLRLRRTKEYCNLAKAEIIRMLIAEGIGAMQARHKPPTQSKTTS